jgi:hypothetical protein
MPHITDQEKLKRNYRLRLVSIGPKGGMWRGHYLKCPLCGYLVLKGNGYDECTCGNITIDSAWLRVSVETPESEVKVYNATKKTRMKHR